MKIVEAVTISYKYPFDLPSNLENFYILLCDSDSVALFDEVHENVGTFSLYYNTIHLKTVEVHRKLVHFNKKK